MGHQHALDIVYSLLRHRFLFPIRATGRRREYELRLGDRGWIHGVCYLVVAIASPRQLRRTGEFCLSCPGEKSTQWLYKLICPQQKYIPQIIEGQEHVEPLQEESSAAIGNQEKSDTPVSPEP
jgi:hypothetical protein